MSNLQKSLTVDLDELDLVLIRELEVDARQSNMDLAAKLGTSGMTIKRRIQRLVDGNIIRFFTVTHPEALGFNTEALVGINALPGKADSLAGFLASCSGIRAINLTTGRYDMLVSTIHKNPSELFRFVNGDLGRAPGLVSAETMMVLKVVKTSLRHFPGGTTKIEDVKIRPLEEVELRLIKELEQNPRETITGLSEKLGISRVSVSRKLQALRADNIISVGCLARAAAFGYDVPTSILVRARNGDIDAVADALAADKRTYHVIILAGRFDICAWTTFKNPQETASYLRNDIGTIPGITHHETMFEVGLGKLSLSLLA